MRLKNSERVILFIRLYSLYVSMQVTIGYETSFVFHRRVACQRNSRTQQRDIGLDWIGLDWIGLDIRLKDN